LPPDTPPLSETPSQPAREPETQPAEDTGGSPFGNPFGKGSKPADDAAPSDKAPAGPSEKPDDNPFGNPFGGPNRTAEQPDAPNDQSEAMPAAPAMPVKSKLAAPPPDAVLPPTASPAAAEPAQEAAGEAMPPNEDGQAPAPMAPAESGPIPAPPIPEETPKPAAATDGEVDGESQVAAASVRPVPVMAAPPGETLSLRPAPDPTLIELSEDGPLPVVGADGRKPWQVYARPFDSSLNFPRIAMVVSQLGLSQEATETAIERLPGGFTLAFAPHAPDLDQWIGQAREAGHEVMLALPMEPDNYPSSDPGPFTLLTSLTAPQNASRLQWVLSRSSGYVGLASFLGARFNASADHLRPVLDELRRRGLMFLDSRQGTGSRVLEIANQIDLPVAVSNGFVDEFASRLAIDAALGELEKIARDTGAAVGMAQPYPVSFDRLRLWAKSLPDKGLVLAPISALANRQVRG
jgi:polysaccharide deacetylase 2 family uncharacterized protein YibQ